MREALKSVMVDDPHSIVFTAHAWRVFNALENLVGVIDVDGVLQESLAHLRAQHVDRGTKPAYFKVGYGVQSLVAVDLPSAGLVRLCNIYGPQSS